MFLSEIFHKSITMTFFGFSLILTHLLVISEHVKMSVLPTIYLSYCIRRLYEGFKRLHSASIPLLVHLFDAYCVYCPVDPSPYRQWSSSKQTTRTRCSRLGPLSALLTHLRKDKQASVHMTRTTPPSRCSARSSSLATSEGLQSAEQAVSRP